MSVNIPPLTQRPAWKALEEHYQRIRTLHLRTLFAEDPRRGERFATEAVGIYFDYSKNRITEETMRLLRQLAESSGLQERIEVAKQAKDTEAAVNLGISTKRLLSLLDQAEKL